MILENVNIIHFNLYNNIQDQNRRLMEKIESENKMDLACYASPTEKRLRN